MGRIRRFRDGFSKLTPRREYIYKWGCSDIDDVYYGRTLFRDLHDYQRRKWSRIRKINHRRKK
ncbi:MAG: hypothetical protein J5965_26765 [Aeriscardovia sp.]|nr:hypothetical protein [Aeriscardovia sp.]